jgi:hypothetical protein
MVDHSSKESGVTIHRFPSNEHFFCAGLRDASAVEDPLIKLNILRNDLVRAVALIARRHAGVTPANSLRRA